MFEFLLITMGFLMVLIVCGVLAEHVAPRIPWLWEWGERMLEREDILPGWKEEGGLK